MTPHLIVKLVTCVGFFVGGAVMSIADGDWGAFLTCCIIVVVFWKLA